jgi:predicted nuclease of predicted toxin-antitoxin system
MRFLTNENIARSVVVGLQAAGHDCVSVKEVMAGATDTEVLSLAMAEARILVTFDKDFGELAFRSRLPASCGVVLFRITPLGREQDVKRVLETLESRDDWSGAFWTITDERMRRRPLPPAGEFA